MSAMTKRDFLKSTLLGASALGLPASMALALETPKANTVHVYDSRIPQSIAFAKQAMTTGTPCFDLAREELALWRNVRNGFDAPAGAVITGITLWSDWLVVRGALEPMGWRVAHEVHLDEIQRPQRASPGTKSALFAWSMT